MDKYLPGVPNDKKAITLHHLLTHTAGFPSEIGDDYEAIRRDPYVERALAGKLRSEPGSKYHYSNVGYSLLAAIVERVSRQTYEALPPRAIVPSGGDGADGLSPPEVAPPTRFPTDTRKTRIGEHRSITRGTPDGPYWNLLGNGGILTTAGDMLRWHRALAGETVLSADAKKKMFTPHVAEDASGEVPLRLRLGRRGAEPIRPVSSRTTAATTSFSPTCCASSIATSFVFLATNAWKREFEKLGQALAAAVRSP